MDHTATVTCQYYAQTVEANGGLSWWITPDKRRSRPAARRLAYHRLAYHMVFLNGRRLTRTDPRRLWILRVSDDPLGAVAKQRP